MSESRKFPQNIQHVHLIAVCGTGVGSLAGLLKEKGFKVSGSDQNTYPPMSTELENLGVKLYSGYKPENLDDRPDLVIVGNAVSKTNPEVVALLERSIPYCSMPEALSHFFITGKESICVAGTHGKTTTTALISHLLLELGADPSYLVGGILQAGEKNYRLGKGKYFAIEGDEYDTAFFDKGSKFLHYQPFHTLITSLEFDHADIFRDLDHMSASFEALIEKINPKGHLYACAAYPKLVEIIKKARVPVTTYGLSVTPRLDRGAQKMDPAVKPRDDADYLATNLQFGLQTTFDIFHRGQKEATLVSPMAGAHNVLNTLVAYALLRNLGFTPEQFQQALSTFKGVKRRQEIRATIGDIIVMDDFAHHPTAVKETIEAVKNRFPGHALWAVFEPRSNSSKRAVFQKDYAQAFDKADHIIFAPVFMPEKVPAGEKPLDTAQLVQDLSSHGLQAQCLPHIDDIVSHLTKQVKSPAVILIMSNGGFGGIHEKLIVSLKTIQGRGNS